MSGRPIRAAILGCGSIARRHCEAFQANGIPVVAVADTSPEAARTLAGLAGPGTAVHPSAEALFDAGGFELLSICTPPLFHAEAAVRALERNLHVLCEKPLAANIADAREIEKAAARSSGRLMVAFRHRFLDSTERIRSLLAEGVLGDVILFRNEFHSSLTPAPGSWFFQRRIAGGGCLIDTGSHSIDLFRHLFGEITGAEAVLNRRLPATDVEDSAVLLVRSRENVSGVLVSSFGAVGRAEIEITGRLGRLRYEYGGTIRLECPAANRHEVIVPKPGNGFAAEVAAFLQAIAAGTPPPVSLTDGLRVQEIIDACYRSVQHAGETIS